MSPRTQNFGGLNNSLVPNTTDIFLNTGDLEHCPCLTEALVRNQTLRLLSDSFVVVLETTT